MKPTVVHKASCLMFLILSLVFGVVYGMNDEDVTIKIDDRHYTIARDRAYESQRLQEMLEKKAETGDEAVVDLTGEITNDLFEHIYEELTDNSYKPYHLDDAMINNLVHASEYLKIPWLVNYYNHVKDDRATHVTLAVGNKEYTITLEQAKQSKTLRSILEDVEDHTEVIPLPLSLKKVFDYIYNDLTWNDYDTALVSDAELIDLINAANYLDAHDLLEKYRKLFVGRLTNSEGQAELIRYKYLFEKLPIEMQLFVAELIQSKSKELYLTLPQVVERVESREHSGEELYISPDTSVCLCINSSKDSMAYDLIKNILLWQKEMVRSNRIIFSSDSTQFLCYKDHVLKLFDTRTGEQIWQKNYAVSSNSKVNFFSEAKKIVIHNAKKGKIDVIDSETGDVAFGLQYDLYRIVDCAYASNEKLLVIKYQQGLLSCVSVVRADTGKEIKTLDATNLEEALYISPDGQKIMKSTRNFFKVENSAIDKFFVLNFHKPLKKHLGVTSFSRDNRLVALGSAIDNVLYCIALDKSVNPVEYLHIFDEGSIGFSSLFSPNSRELLVRSETLLGVESFKLLEAEREKVKWMKPLQPVIGNPLFVYEDFVAFATTLPKNNFKIEFYTVHAGNSRVESRVQDSREYLENSFKFQGIKNNFLYISLNDRIRKEMKLMCFDIGPLALTSSFNEEVPLDQALLTYFILKSIKNDQPFTIESEFEDTYKLLPERLKTMVNEQETQKKKNKLHNALKKTLTGTKRLINTRLGREK